MSVESPLKWTGSLYADRRNLIEDGQMRLLHKLRCMTDVDGIIQHLGLGTRSRYIQVCLGWFVLVSSKDLWRKSWEAT